MLASYSYSYSELWDLAPVMLNFCFPELNDSGLGHVESFQPMHCFAVLSCLACYF